MADNIVEILIKFGVKPEGAKIAAAEIRKVKEETITAGKASEVASKKQTDGMKASGDETRKYQNSLKSLAQQFGDLGGVVKMFFHGAIVGGVAVAVAAFRAISTESKKMEEGFAASMEAMATPLTNIGEKFREMEAERTRSNEAFKTSLGTISEEAKLAEAKLNAVVTATNALVDAQERLELSQVKNDPEKEAEIKLKYATLRVGNGRDADAAKLGLLTAEQERLARLGQSQSDIAGHYSGGRNREQVEAALKAGTASLEESVRKQDEVIATQKAAVSSVFKFSGGVPSPIKTAIEEDDLAAIRGHSRTLTLPGGAARASLVALISSMETKGKLGDSLRDAKAEMPRLEKAAAAYKAQDEIISKTAALEAQKKTIREVAAARLPIENQAAAVTEAGRLPQGAQLMAGANAADAVRAGKNLDATSKAAFFEAMQILGGNAQNWQSILELLSNMNNDVQGVKAVVSRIQSRQNTSANSPFGS